MSGDYELREDFQKFVVPDFLSRSDEGRSRYIRKITLSTMEELYAADGPETFGWIAISGYDNTKSLHLRRTLVAAAKEYRSFMQAGKVQVRYGPTHYHVRQDCKKEKNEDFNPVAGLELSPTDYEHFLPAHEKLLQQEFGIEL